MIKKLGETSKKLILNQRGQGLVEYALILVLIAVAIMTSITTLRCNISTSYSRIGSSITTTP
jgi:Flp pilus assembly pilin Flp